MLNRREIGAWGEQLAAAWLQKQGYEIIAQNYYTRWGEIDIIARGPEWFSFIEVKLRTRGAGSAERAITPIKRAHWQKAAQAFCLREPMVQGCAIIFEQISLYVDRVARVVRCRKYIVPPA